ncbi:hypothetical protein L9W97_01840 [Vibrio aestuarianus]|uniref:hypothetical protein n=1 Tax=Vibrio aestuarianus TaxID=28171 RepID=UPI00237CCFC5|nr:hypothetical protein [Vibrio aestuarianus]MDE1323861.1 hypothetical protein [Vibrio aestuarianus]
MKYANQEKTAVVCNHPINGEQWTVPRGHRFWSEFGIDEAEAKGQIEDADPILDPLGS